MLTTYYKILIYTFLKLLYNNLTLNLEQRIDGSLAINERDLIPVCAVVIYISTSWRSTRNTKCCRNLCEHLNAAECAASGADNFAHITEDGCDASRSICNSECSCGSKWTRCGVRVAGIKGNTSEHIQFNTTCDVEGTIYNTLLLNVASNWGHVIFII